MKRSIYIVAFLALFAGIFPSPLVQRANAQVSVSFQVFYDRLSPFGSWVSYPSYGYVWVPTAVPYGFRPYGSGGHWVYTDEGWTWISNYEWGWAPFHYGNWFYDDSYGWMWVPGYDWAPAWVTWGEYRNEYCWAPIGPGISVSIDSYRPPAYYWNFVPRERIASVYINNYYVRNESRTTIVNNITMINNINRGNGSGHTAYVRGPEPQIVQKYTHSPVRLLPIRPSSRPGGGSVQQGQLAIYRPTFKRPSSNSYGTPAPARVQDLHTLRPAALSANAHVQTNNPSSIQRRPSSAASTNRQSADQARAGNRNSVQQVIPRPKATNRSKSLPQNHPSANQTNPRPDIHNQMQIQQQRVQSRPQSPAVARSYPNQNYQNFDPRR